MLSINAADIISFTVFAFSLFRVWNVLTVKIAKLESTVSSQQLEIGVIKSELDSRSEELTQVRLVMEKINTTLSHTNEIITEMKDTNKELSKAIQQLQIQQAEIDHGKKGTH